MFRELICRLAPSSYISKIIIVLGRKINLLLKMNQKKKTRLFAGSYNFNFYKTFAKR